MKKKGFISHDIIGHVFTAKQYRSFIEKKMDETLLLEFDGDPDIYLGVVVAKNSDSSTRWSEEKKEIDWERVKTVTEAGQYLGVGLPRLISSEEKQGDEFE